MSLESLNSSNKINETKQVKDIFSGNLLTILIKGSYRTKLWKFRTLLK